MLGVLAVTFAALTLTVFFFFLHPLPRVVTFRTTLRARANRRKHLFGVLFVQNCNFAPVARSFALLV